MPGSRRSLPAVLTCAATAENVVVVVLDIRQDGPVQFRGRADRKAARRIQVGDARDGLGVELLVALHLEAHEAPASDPCVLPGLDVGIAQPKLLQFILRQVHPARLPVLPHVAEDVGHLHRHAQLDRVGIGRSRHRR